MSIEVLENGVKVYNKYGIGFFGNYEEYFYEILKFKLIDNLEYVEALDALKKLKEKYEHA